MIWLVLALLVALLAVGLGVCALIAWNEPVRRGATVLDFTPRKEGKR